MDTAMTHAPLRDFHKLLRLQQYSSIGDGCAASAFVGTPVSNTNIFSTQHPYPLKHTTRWETNRKYNVSKP